MNLQSYEVIAEIGALLLSGIGVVASNAGIYQLGLLTCLTIAFIVFAAG